LKRPNISGRNPLHVTWRTEPGTPNLRTYYPSTIIRKSIRDSQKEAFGIVEYSIQTNHVHMMTEASSSRALELGMRGLARRITSRLSKKVQWEGRLFTRYHFRELHSPRETRNALRYVLLNARHHFGEEGTPIDPSWIDPYSSGYWFDGWKLPIRDLELIRTCRHLDRPTVPARTWLLTVGWKRWGLLDFE
jgi:REP-associated tyrosine transposase